MTSEAPLAWLGAVALATALLGPSRALAEGATGATPTSPEATPRPDPPYALVTFEGSSRDVALGSEGCRVPCTLRVDPGSYLLNVRGMSSRRVNLSASRYRVDVSRPSGTLWFGVALAASALALVPAGFLVQAVDDPCASKPSAARQTCTEPSTVVWLAAGGLGLVGLLPLVFGAIDFSSGMHARLSRDGVYLSGASGRAPRVRAWASPVTGDGRGARVGLQLSF